jgi:DUF917 family protein
MVVATDRDEIFLIEGNISYERLEIILRSMTGLSKSGVIYLLGAPLQVKKLVKNNLTRPSLSKALSFGQIRNLKTLSDLLNPKIIIKVNVLTISDFDQQGFMGKIVITQDKNLKIYKLFILNEVILILDKNNKILASVPDRILLIDQNKLEGLSGVFLENDQNLTIAVIPPDPEWNTNKAHKIFGKNRFILMLNKALKFGARGDL